MSKFSLDLQREQLSTQVADRLQEMILAQSLADHEKLPAERELAETLQVSRSVVREAIRILVSRGLLKVKPGSGTYVCRPTARDTSAPLALALALKDDPFVVDHLFEVRRTLEGRVAELAALHATGEDLDALAKAIKEMEEAIYDPLAYSALDIAFHIQLAKAAHNELFGLLLQAVRQLLEDTIQVALLAEDAAPQGLAFHREIIGHIECGGAQAARQAMERHIDMAQKNYQIVYHTERV